jgi:hypothetical protein
MYRTRKQIAAFLRALPTGNGYSPHDLAAAVDGAVTGLSVAPASAPQAFLGRGMSQP